MRWWALAVSVLAVLVLGGAAGLYAFDRSQRDRFPEGVRVGHVNLGGLRLDKARARLERRLVRRIDRPVIVRAGSRAFRLTPRQAGLRVNVDGLLREAMHRSRPGSFARRLVGEVRHTRAHTQIPLRVSYSRQAVDTFVHEISTALAEPSADASVTPSAAGLQLGRSHEGVAVRSVALRYRVARALVHPFARRQVVAPMRAVEPKLTLAALRAKYPAYIIVDRSRFQLMLFRHLRLAHTYTIAVGRAGLETPAGLYDVQWKQVDPPWIVPNSAWAGALAGKTIPPGPQDPIKARWLAFNGGAGIHGTDETWSLGHDASHGCIRMSIPDVIQLYDLAPVHSPVFVA